MQGYQYKHGDRPLEGFTIQRAVGRGGFGEVYYALSDSGREVALKCVQGYEEIELRGIRQCMNLKSPYLVTIFDVKHNDQDRPFVIMEYVSGPSLRDLLNESPSGLGAQKAAFFLREIGKGLTYLHDRGIVHRDLKPGNIFYEDGYVKIGDYGLSKVMTASQHSGQTITVGTVHYMAPEIGKGRYDQGIDIYALGIVLFEMLTGQVPFFGASPGEILMKHMASDPDLSGIEEPFARVIRRAMDKDPERRYRTVQEMVEDVFGAEHVRESVSHFRPESLSEVAERIGQKVAAGVRAGASGSSGDPTVTLGRDVPPGQGGSSAWGRPENWWEDFGRRMGQWGEQMGRWGERFGSHVGREVAKQARQFGESSVDSDMRVRGDPKQDPLKRHQRRILAFTAAGIVAVAVALATPFGHDDSLLTGLGTFCALVGSALGILIAERRLGLQSESDFVKRLAYGGLACVLGVIFLVPTVILAGYLNESLGRAAITICVAIFLVNWPKRTNPGREERVSLGCAFAAGLAGLIVSAIGGGDMLLATGFLAGLSLTAQVASAFDPKSARDLRRHLAEMEEFWQGSVARGAPAEARPGIAPAPPPPPAARPEQNAAERAVPGRRGIGEHGLRAGEARQHDRGSASLWHAVEGVPVPVWVRPVALLVFMILLGVGVACLVWAGTTRSDDELVIGVCVGVSSLLLSLFCLVKSLQLRFVSWWSSLVKPLVMIACLTAVLTASMVLGVSRLGSDETAIAVFFIVFPSLLFLVAAVLPNAAMHSLFGGAIPRTPSPPSLHTVSTRRRLWAFLLACAGFLGVGGLQRFYVGKVGTGLIWLLTVGLFYMGTLYDLILIALGKFRDRHGLPLIVWHSDEELRRSSVSAAAKVGAPPGPQAAVEITRDLREHREVTQPSGGRATSDPAASARSAAGNRDSFDFAGIVLSAIGGVFLLVTLVTGLALAAELPAMLAAGLPEPDVAAELTKAFGYAGWPKLLDRILTIATVSSAFLATGFLVVARRRSGALHITRAVFGSFGLLFALYPVLAESFRHVQWDAFSEHIRSERIGPAVEMILNSVDSVGAAIAAGIALVSIMVLAWPARRRAPETVYETAA
ncbi:MAG: protein kinase [Phycisphaerae bacterium]|nr:protein kinase [Phycisphaerae bacterium]